MFTILHLSDLHRSVKSPVSNDFLLSCLLIDIEKHSKENPKISKCDVIVVTGDIVEGTDIDDNNAEETLRNQYGEAKEFLVRLCNELLDGNRRRLLLTPGNHDISWWHAMKSMRKLAQDTPKIGDPRAASNSPYRWSWKDLNYYLVEDPELYKRRLRYCKEFFDDFYAGLNCSFDLDIDKNAISFELPESRALFTSYTSLFGNDCFDHRGIISEDAIALSSLQMKGSPLGQIPLKIAFWHHSIEANGYRDDYMNPTDTLPLLIDRGYVLGMHGHQHKSGMLKFGYKLDPKRFMPVISCGSLCAGPNDLPPGSRRQYNILEIDENTAKCRIHVREWFNNKTWIPARLPEFGGNTWIEVELPILQDNLTQQSNVVTAIAIEKSEHLMRDGDYEGARVMLSSLSVETPIVRKLMADILLTLERWGDLRTLIKIPQNSEELGMMFDCLLHEKKFKEAEELLKDYVTKPDIYDKGLIEKLQYRLKAEEKVRQNT